jgi:hypothetical protein
MSDSGEPCTAQKITPLGETPAFVPDQASGHGLDDVPRRVVFVQRGSQLNGLGNACLHVEGESRFLEFQIRFGVVL